jgi:predicted nucleotidyltransferase
MSTLTEFCGMPPDSFGKYLDEQKLDIICKTIYGSHLYQTNIEGSDEDIRGLYLPTKQECFLGKTRPTIDILGEDSQLFSLQRFMRLAAEGQSVALELLFTPDDKTIVSSPIWENLKKHRNKFLTKKLNHSVLFLKAWL